MENTGKRKNPPAGGAGQDGSRPKKSKGGSGGRWQTPHQKAKLDSSRLRSGPPQHGDAGIWATCQRHKERQAIEEMMELCHEYGEKLFGIARPLDEAAAAAAADGEDDEDIEASIQRELEALKPQKKAEAGEAGKDAPTPPAFEALRAGVDCVFFVRMRAPADPLALTRAICEDAVSCPDRKQRRARFVNRLTPIVDSAKPSATGVEELSRKVLKDHFHLASDEPAGASDDKATSGEEKTQEEHGQDDAFSYAIRPSVRACSTISRDEVIKRVASLISPRHKVNLSSPDKVILIDIFQTSCGMSVVDGDWDSLKRYNLYELYEQAFKKADATEQTSEE